MDTEKLKTLALAAMDSYKPAAREARVSLARELDPAAVLELIAEVERLRAERDTEITEHNRDLHKLICMQTEHDELRAEVERLRADAGRYRWLRNPKRSHAHVGRIVDNSGKAACLAEFALDRAIDAAIEKEKA